MDTEKIVQDLNRRFSAPLPEFYNRRIIFWYDEDQEFADKLDWSEISEHQLFSVSFILKFKDRLNFQTLQNRIDLPFIVQVPNKQ